MANFPLAPRYAKMLALGRQHGCLPYIIALVSALSVREVFVSSDGDETLRADRLVKLHRSWVGKVSRVGRVIIISLISSDLVVIVGFYGYS